MVWGNKCGQRKKRIKGARWVQTGCCSAACQPCLPLASAVCPVSSLSTVPNTSPGRWSFSVHVGGVRVQQPEWDQGPEGPMCLGPAAGETEGRMCCACASAASLLTSSQASQSAGQEVAMSLGWTQERPLGLHVGYWRNQEVQASCQKDPRDRGTSCERACLCVPLCMR